MLFHILLQFNIIETKRLFLHTFSLPHSITVFLLVAFWSVTDRLRWLIAWASLFCRVSLFHTRSFLSSVPQERILTVVSKLPKITGAAAVTYATITLPSTPASRVVWGRTPPGVAFLLKRLRQTLVRRRPQTVSQARLRHQNTTGP